jgi:ABC-type nitrate/sulfonate/bicarbonate transport system permease component
MMAASNGMVKEVRPVVPASVRLRGFDLVVLAQWLGAAAGVLALALLWEAAPRLGWIDSTFFPPLSVVLAKLASLCATAEFWVYVASTVRTWVLGLAIATASGVLAGLVIGLTPGARKYTHSTVEFLRPIPSVALIPGVILLFGSRYQSGVVLITYAAFWQVFMQMLYGLNDIDTVARDTSRSFRFSRLGFVRHVAWPKPPMRPPRPTPSCSWRGSWAS